MRARVNIVPIQPVEREVQLTMDDFTAELIYDILFDVQCKADVSKTTLSARNALADVVTGLGNSRVNFPFRSAVADVRISGQMALVSRDD